MTVRLIVWGSLITLMGCSENPLDPDEINGGSVINEEVTGGAGGGVEANCANTCNVLAQCQGELGLQLADDCETNFCLNTLDDGARQCVVGANQCVEAGECIGITCDAVCEVLLQCGAQVTAEECPDLCNQQIAVPSRTCVLLSNTCDEVAGC
ncbi:MAG: hypothetical protein ACE366_31950 [Bradymonadia bacterium]